MRLKINLLKVVDTDIRIAESIPVDVVLLVVNIITEPTWINTILVTYVCPAIP
jgi:hypothetical protein